MLVGSALLVALACAPDGAAPPKGAPGIAETVPPRLVLLYATCTVNKDYLSPYSPELSFTPHLERFAREAVVFERHQSEAGQSGTAFAALFTGLQADRHGVFRHPTPLAEDLELIGETFRRGGYETRAWLEHGMASGELGYAQGADVVRAELLRPDDPDFLALLDDLARDPSRRAFVVVDFTVTHGPYQLAALDAFCARHPEECGAAEDRESFLRYVDFYRKSHAFLSYDFPRTAERSGLAGEHLDHLVAAIELLYRANIAYLDHLFGGVTEAIRERGLWDESAIVFTADHGETLFREGTYFKWTHGGQLAPEVLNVPMLLKAPGIEPGRYGNVSRSIDVYPTLAALAGLNAPSVELGDSDTVGVDLGPALRGTVPPPLLRAFSHTGLLPEPVLEASKKWELFNTLYPRIDPELMWFQMRDGDRVVQLRRSLGGELEPAVFDLAVDPTELDNLFDPADSDQRRAFRDLETYRRRLLAAAVRTGGDGVSRERQEELLRSLSYID